MIKTKKFYSQGAELFELAGRVLCDTAAAGKADAAYLFANTADNEKAVLETGANLWKRGLIKFLAVYGDRHKDLYAGPVAWNSNLVTLGVKSSAIVPVPLVGDFPPSTDAEATGFIRLAFAKRWKAAYVVSTPLHQVRAFVSMVSALKREQKKNHLTLDLYSKPTRPLDWNEYNIHSQYQKGVKARRRDLFARELAKINTYYSKGDLVSAAGVIEYFNHRRVATKRGSR